jgi:hypothetical protein
VKWGHKHRNFEGLHRGFLHKSFCGQDDTIAYYTRMNFGPTRKPQRYGILSVARNLDGIFAKKNKLQPQYLQ